VKRLSQAARNERLGLRVSKATREALAVEAARRGVSVNALVVEAIARMVAP